MKSIIFYLFIVFCIPITSFAQCNPALDMTESGPGGTLLPDHYLRAKYVDAVGTTEDRIVYSADGYFKATGCTNCGVDIFGLDLMAKKTSSSTYILRKESVDVARQFCGAWQKYKVCGEDINVGDVAVSNDIAYRLMNITDDDDVVTNFIHTLPAVSALSKHDSSMIVDIERTAKPAGVFHHLITVSVYYEMAYADRWDDLYVKLKNGTKSVRSDDLEDAPKSAVLGRKYVTFRITEMRDERELFNSTYDLQLIQDGTIIESTTATIDKVCDWDGDGDVDNDDKQIGLDNNGSTDTLEGDADFDGTVEFDDENDDDWEIWEDEN
jgi:hypothetical protein